jgi:hypothetical protein
MIIPSLSVDGFEDRNPPIERHWIYCYSTPKLQTSIYPRSK